MNVLIVEYPGYSIYSEEKSSDKVLKDTLYVFDYLTKILEVDPENIFVFGRSIGSAPGSYLSSERKFRGLILMSPFTTVKNVAKSLVSIFSILVSDR